MLHFYWRYDPVWVMAFSMIFLIAFFSAEIVNLTSFPQLGGSEAVLLVTLPGA
jgi:hypothetical protein